MRSPCFRPIFFDEKARIYIKYVLTHAEYDQEDWKNDPYF
ncbi:MAG: type II toxin-antitoxin system HigB family toxin [Woronichinia naegeliana WA131]|uniref:Type II toxin-antitoxin system HigB family toxin n=1 Tax=Woronichinia naegeliana WA131 TaxID=2824559 RepID=A0A977KVD2_9CYAN|nr:MAG: type II toxin-antitoxin system HigB family toxin [Woronichinia naegeliana WA131]